jgi:hypothetical protein
MRTNLAMLAAVLLAVSIAPVRGDEPVTAGELRGAVARALPLIRKGAEGHMAQRTCFACHNQGVPLLAMAVARDRGFDVKDDDLKKQARFIADVLAGNRDNYRKGKGTGGQADTAGYALWALDLGGWQPDDTTAAVADYLLIYQKDIDHWITRANRPPSEISPFTTTYIALRGLLRYGTADQKDRIDRRVAEVRSWLVKAPPRDNEDRVFRLRGLHLAGADEFSIKLAARELVAMQRADGGWGQLDSMASDAYATGSALVALTQAGGLATSDPAYQRGLRYLLQTQLKDGSWYVKSRSRPFQTYYESGFPHGKDQFISIAGSSWAAAALALACPPGEAKDSR